MSDTTTDSVETPAAPKKSGAKSGGLGGKVLAELQEIAADLNISGASGMRKGELIDAIKAARGDAAPAKAPTKAAKDDSAAESTAESAQESADEAAAADGDEPTRRGGNQNQGNQGGNQNNQNGDEAGGRRRNRRGRNRNTRGGDGEPVVSDDDVLVPAAGILDILDNYAFVRTTGYLPSEADVYVSLSMVKKWGLRKGDAIVGQVRQPREGERKEKFNPMVRVDSVNGMTIDDAKKRVEFGKLTPLYPTERLRLEGDAAGLTGRVIDLVAPIGKGQRGLIVSPPKAGKTMVMQQIANAITENNPEVHLMVVLVDERPEEVTDFQRTVKGEVIASTFDRPATDHTTTQTFGRLMPTDSAARASSATARSEMPKRVRLNKRPRTVTSVTATPAANRSNLLTKTPARSSGSSEMPRSRPWTWAPHTTCATPSSTKLTPSVARKSVSGVRLTSGRSTARSMTNARATITSSESARAPQAGTPSSSVPTYMRAANSTIEP